MTSPFLKQYEQRGHFDAAHAPGMDDGTSDELLLSRIGTESANIRTTVTEVHRETTDDN